MELKVKHTELRETVRKVLNDNVNLQEGLHGGFLYFASRAVTAIIVDRVLCQMSYYKSVVCYCA